MADAQQAALTTDAAYDNAKPGGRFGALKPFVIVSSSYLLYTITDGAIRMIVLLYAYQLGFSAMEVALMCVSAFWSSAA